MLRRRVRKIRIAGMHPVRLLARGNAVRGNPALGPPVKAPNGGTMKVTELESASEFWIRPPRSAKGDPDAKQVYEAVGFALSTWEMLENNFSFLFTLFVDTDSHAARRAYGSLANNTARTDALRGAAEVFFSEWAVTKPEQEQFARLMDHFGRASEKRNEIAHGIVMNVMEMGHFLIPPDYNSSKMSSFLDDEEYKKDTIARLRAQYRYTRNDINELSRRFAKLADATIEYVFSIRKKYLKRG
jgi:hypothetical protein